MQLVNLDKKGVSVVIVTYNGRDRIIPVINSLLKQEPTHFEWEILLIDNNSIDDTAILVNDYIRNNCDSLPFRCIIEPVPGTLYARERGIAEASYRYVLFCDDDNVLQPDYLSQAYKAIKKNAKIAAVGGKGIFKVVGNELPPDWIQPYKHNFGTGPQGNNDGDTTHIKGCLYSAGAIFDRQWLNILYKYGFRSSLTGRTNKSLIAGEDTEITYALKLIGAELHYSSKMKFFHYMPKKRLSWKYLKKLYRSFGYSDFIISPYNEAVKSFYYQYFFKDLISTLILFFIIYFKTTFLVINRKGSPLILQRERIRGKLSAMILDLNKYKRNKQMVKLLQKKIRKPISQKKFIGK